MNNNDNDNDNDDENRYDDIFNFLEEENKKILKETRWSFRHKLWLKLKKIRWIIMPEYIFLRNIFYVSVIRTGYWLNSRWQDKRDSIMVLLIAIALFTYQLINTI